MKIRLKNLRLSYPDLFEPGKKFGKFGAQFRFDSEDVKKELEDAIEAIGEETFKAKWPLTKKTLAGKGKLFKVNDGSDKEYKEKYFISVHSKDRPLIRGQKCEVLAESDNVLYPGCRVDAILHLSAYSHKEYGPIVSVKLQAVQFRGDAERYSGPPRADDSDFIEISDDGEDL